ncbi:hypothetical protein DdX_04593 [Ditylenchus destructor]|uniref:Uncharacterized protein n=1 Tax=Ditylenchus destructor TaxID=166010 RepID=A0AAD4NBW7_9BILA|nr:hypothetical protein DdX_04593 [Ditylenchus destructor]
MPHLYDVYSFEPIKELFVFSVANLVGCHTLTEPKSRASNLESSLLPFQCGYVCPKGKSSFRYESKWGRSLNQPDIIENSKGKIEKSVTRRQSTGSQSQAMATGSTYASLAEGHWALDALRRKSHALCPLSLTPIARWISEVGS